LSLALVVVLEYRRRPLLCSCNYVALLDVLEHQPDDRALMNQLVAKMVPGSTLLVAVPAMPSLRSAWDVALGHYRRYDEVALSYSIEGLPLLSSGS
jgi:hypothetical protein